jgi:hypothetical protein
MQVEVCRPLPCECQLEVFAAFYVVKAARNVFRNARGLSGGRFYTWELDGWQHARELDALDHRRGTAVLACGDATRQRDLLCAHLSLGNLYRDAQTVQCAIWLRGYAGTMLWEERSDGAKPSIPDRTGLE